MMELYAQARVFMRENGNPNQWDENYPSRELLEKDIAFGPRNLGMSEEEIKTAVTHAGNTSTGNSMIRSISRKSENGAWLNHEPYGTIHRLAGNTSYHGIASGCISWCKSQIGNLRADTHEDNKIMQHLLEKNGFVRCGIIHLANGAPRIAYQFAGDSFTAAVSKQGGKVVYFLHSRPLGEAKLSLEQALERGDAVMRESGQHVRPYAGHAGGRVAAVHRAFVPVHGDRPHQNRHRHG